MKAWIWYFGATGTTYNDTMAKKLYRDHQDSCLRRFKCETWIIQRRVAKRTPTTSLADEGVYLGILFSMEDN